jgi:hypothetical protein
MEPLMTGVAVPAGIVPPRRAQPALDRAAHAAVDAADLPATDDLGQRRSDHVRPADDVWAHRGRFVARPREHRPDVGSASHNVAVDHDSIDALVRFRLERGYRLSECADACFRGAWLDLAARAVAGPTTPAPPGRRHAPEFHGQRRLLAVVATGGASPGSSDRLSQYARSAP